MAKVECFAIDALKPNARNARTHSKKQIRQIADSIAAFGFVVPIVVDEGGIIISGHGRYAAAKLLGLRQVPVLEVTGPVGNEAACTRDCGQQNRGKCGLEPRAAGRRAA